MAPVRRGGRGTLPDGAQLTWSLAEGGRGRRWRASRVRDGRLEGTILLEIDAAGRPARLELGTADGLLTLHPDRGERELHGNVVTPDGIRHLRLDWSPAHELVVDGFPVALLAAVRRLGAVIAGWRDGRTPRGHRRQRPALPCDDDPPRAARRAPLARGRGGERGRRGDRRRRRAGRPG